MEDFFKRRIEVFNRQALDYGNRSNLFTIARIVVFVSFLAVWIFLIYEELFTPFLFSLLLFPFLFGFLVNRHKKINYQQQFYQHLVLINEEEVNRLGFKPKHFSNGTAFMDEDHTYSGDLDIFGPKSLYHFINRAATPSGEDTLAAWLSTPAGKEEIVKRQESILELREEIDWRQEIQATEMVISGKGSVNAFLDWLQNSDNPVFKGVIYLLPLLTVLSLALWFIGSISFYVVLGFFLLNGYLIARNSARTKELSEVTDQGLAILKKYRHILFLIEKKNFETVKLQEIQRHFNEGSYKASVSLRRLERILEFLYARSNMFYHILNFIFLLDLQLILQAERWRKRNKDYVGHWFDAIGELEALSGFAGYLFAHNGLQMPEIVDDEYLFEAKQLGHPMIPTKERVANDYNLSGKGTVHIITGSNMSGKSTFLRTVCINAVLAYAGGPVCADRARLSIFQVFTSMRTHDDLEAHVSSFYAELKRIKKLLQLIKNSTSPYLFALDEVLKGTNSHDRNTGASALARQLHQQNCMGMISTHDLELGELAKQEDNIVNYSFNSDITGDEIIFDYKLHPGICKSFNASKLMEQMGIAINQQ